MSKTLHACLKSAGKNAGQLAFLRNCVGEVIDSFVTLTTQRDPFNFDSFSHAIDEPVQVFDFDEDSASYHAAAEDLVYSLVLAMFPKNEPSRITRQDAETLSATDIKGIAAALCNTTGHDLRDAKQRLSKLAHGVAKEYARLRVKHPTKKCAATSDSIRTLKETSLPRLPVSVNVLDLCRLLNKELPNGKTQSQIAREFMRETDGDDRKAQALLRQARRFPHLWRRSKG